MSGAGFRTDFQGKPWFSEFSFAFEPPLTDQQMLRNLRLQEAQPGPFSTASAPGRSQASLEESLYPSENRLDASMSDFC